MLGFDEIEYVTFWQCSDQEEKKNCIAIVISQPSRSDMRDSSSEKIITFLDTLVVHYNYILRVNDFVSNFLLD